MPKECTCRLVADPWCRVYYAHNRIKARWNRNLMRFEWKLTSGAWGRLPDGTGIEDANRIARRRARILNPNAYAAWERRMKARQ